MSIQFRSRVRSVFDFGKELKQAGKCCFSDGTSSSITFFECFSQGGQFFTDPNTVCPSPSEKGHCCACAYLNEDERQSILNNLPFDITNPFYINNTFGIQTNITQCECNRIGGNWIASTNPISSTLCRRDVLIDGLQKTIDVRIPNACCTLIIQDGFPVGMSCQHVCGERECANLAIVESGPNDPFVDTVFTANKVCTRNIVAGVAPVTCSSTPVTSRLTTASSAFEDQSFGPCFELQEADGEYSYTCSLTPSFMCNGYWIDPATISSDVAFCNHPFAPDPPTQTTGYINPSQYTQEEFDALGLVPGDEFQGGIYLGIFKPKKPNATNPSKVYGALNFSTPQSMFVDVTDESPYTKWALIVNKTSLETSLLTDEDGNTNTNTSYYDGYINCYGEPSVSSPITSRTINSTAGIQRNGFIDYYIPSIIEMMFLAEQYRNNTSLSDVLDINGFYCSTTFFSDRYSAQFPNGQNIFNNLNFLYGINLSNNENFGKSTLYGINRTVRLMLFRRIVIN
jgi:hypothetical protein